MNGYSNPLIGQLAWEQAQQQGGYAHLHVTYKRAGMEIPHPDLYLLGGVATVPAGRDALFIEGESEYVGRLRAAMDAEFRKIQKELQLKKRGKVTR